MVPKEWRETSLKKVVSKGRKITYGIVQPGPYHDDGILLIRGKDYSFGWVKAEDFFRVSPEIDRPYTRSKVIEDDLLVTIVGAGTGNVAIVPSWLEGANITQTTARISVDKERYDHKYIYYLLDSPFGARQVYKYIKGGAQPGLNLGDVEKFIFKIPPLPEQKKIARILSTWDKAIETVDKLIENSQQQKKALMQQLLTGKKRLPGFSGEWRFYDFSELFRTANDKSKQLKTSDYCESGNYPIVDQGQSTIAAYTDNKNLYDRVPVIIFGDHTRIVKWVDFPFAPGADGTQILKTKYNIAIKYGFHLLKNTEIPNLGYSRHMRELKGKKFFIPIDKNEQNAIAEILSCQDGIEQMYVSVRESIVSQKQALMQQLLTGKRRVKIDDMDTATA